MLDQVVWASEALLEAAQHGRVVLIPALSGCTACNTVRVIAAPMLRTCEDCEAELAVLSTEQPQHGTSGMRAEVHP